MTRLKILPWPDGTANSNLKLFSNFANSVTTVKETFMYAHVICIA